MFKKATRKAARLRLALIGPPGSGKTWTALTVATHLGGRTAVIDTERGSASKYAPPDGQPANPDKGLFDFEVLELESFSPQEYVKAIKAAEQAGFDNVIIDSLSHAWVGRGGALEMHDNAVARQRTQNTYTAWRDVTPHHNALVDALVQCKANLIGTMRAKTEYVQEKDDRGKTTVRKVGLAPVQRDGLEYEFDVIGDLDTDHVLVVSKSRCSDLADKVIRHPGRDLALTLKAWLGTGVLAEPEPKRKPTPPPPPDNPDEPRLPGGMTQAQHDDMLAAITAVGSSAAKLCDHYGVGSTEEIPAAELPRILRSIENRKKGSTNATAKA